MATLLPLFSLSLFLSFFFSQYIALRAITDASDSGARRVETEMGRVKTRKGRTGIESETPEWEYTVRRTHVSVIVIWMLIG